MSRHRLALFLLLWLQGPGAVDAAPDLALVENKDFTLSLFLRNDRSFDDAVKMKDKRFFHWTLDVSQQGSRGSLVDSFDVSNQAQIRQGPGDAIFNPPRPGKTASDFRFQYKNDVEPGKSSKLIARIKIGTAKAATNQVREALQGLEIPQVCSGESCVEWARSGIRRLQERNWVTKFDVGSFCDKAVQYGFERYAHLRKSKPSFEQFQKEKTAIAEYGKDGVVKHWSRTNPCVIQRRDGSGCRRLTRKEAGQAARKWAAKKFKAMAKSNGLSTLVTRQNSRVSFSQVRTSLSKTLGPQFKAKLGAVKLTGGVLTVASLGLWAKDVVDVFSKESTALERIAVAKSLMPVVGCVSLGALNKESWQDEVLTGLDTGLCIAADIIAFVPGGLAVSFAMHAARAIVKLLAAVFHPPGPPEIEKTHFHYKWGWKQYFSHIEKSMTSDEFRGNLTSQLAAEKLAVIYMASEAAGMVYAGILQQGNSTGLDELDSINGGVDAADLQRRTCNAYFERKERLLDDMANGLEKDLEEAFRKYDDEFFPKYGEWLSNFLLDGRFPSSRLSREVDRMRHDHISQVQSQFKRASNKPGLEPGPGSDQMRARLREVWDDVTRGDACQPVWNPPRRDDEPEPLPALPAPVSTQALEEREAKWRDELGLLTEWEEEQQLQDRVWEAVRQEEWRLRVRSASWPPREGSDAWPDTELWRLANSTSLLE